MMMWTGRDRVVVFVEFTLGGEPFYVVLDQIAGVDSDEGDTRILMKSGEYLACDECPEDVMDFLNTRLRDEVKVVKQPTTLS